MTIQRQYKLPNCTLIVEGLNDGTNNAPSTEMRPLLSMLVNAECHLAASKQPLTGGRDFFESLVTAVSAYGQEFLSKVHHPEAHNNEPGLVQLQKVDNNRHRLIVHSEIRDRHLDASSSSAQSRQVAGGNNPPATASPIQVDLTTVQLFDLVEAVDQFLADNQTLPNLSVQLRPVAKRYAGSSQAVIKQAVPTAVGVSSLTLAAIAFFFVPIPEVRRPIEPKPQSNSAQSTNNVATAPQITEPSQLDALNRKLYNQLNQAWKTRSTVKQDLVYRVGVATNGAIVGYKSVNAAANTQTELTPLPNLLSKPVTGRASTGEPLAQFKVVFTDNGELQVTPWR